MTTISHGLSPEHLATFAESGIPADVANEIAYTETDPAASAKLLNWSGPATILGPCIVIPFLNRDGTPSGFCRVRPSHPRMVDGKPVKYEQPRGIGLRAYFPVQAVPAINTPGMPISILEGEKKTIAACLAGEISIGLTGVFAWQKPQEKNKGKDRELIDDLAKIDWLDRRVRIIFDTDPRRNPNVSLAAAELARILETRGAKTIIVTLPTGPIGADGLPGKMGADDYILAHGQEAFRDYLTRFCAAVAPARKVTDYQRDVARERIDSLQTTGVAFLDRSTQGAGKSTAGIAAKSQSLTSITILATHKNCEEEETTLESHGLAAAAYPKLSADTCQRYPEAEQVMGSGLSVSGALCQSCPHKTGCDYWGGMERAESVSHAISTHSRASLSLDNIADGKRYIDIHEDPAGLLRPSTTASLSSSFGGVADVANYAWRDCVKTDWKATHAPYFELVERYARWIAEQLAGATTSFALDIPDSITPPATADATLLYAMKQIETWPNGDAMKIAKELAAGRICSLAIQIDPILERGGKPAIRKKVVAFRQTILPINATVWLNDATADIAELQAICNLPVVDRTPGGRIEQRFPTIQVPVDLKKSTPTQKLLDVLANVIRLSNCERVGVICDKVHVPAILGTAKQGPVLSPEIHKLVARVEHFRGGEARGSNSWLGACDLMIVVGTPRVPPGAIRERLLRAGKTQAAARTDEQTGWGADWWSGRTVAGKLRTVKTLAYRDRDWHQAHCSIVQAELLQAIGRGRTIRENGMPVIVITTEKLSTSQNPNGFLLSNFQKFILSGMEKKILKVMLSGIAAKGESDQPTIELSGSRSKEYIFRATTTCASSEIAKAVGADNRNTIRVLNDLLADNLVAKIGQRGGWQLTKRGVKIAGGAT